MIATRVWTTRCKRPARHSELDMTQHLSVDRNGLTVTRRYCLACRRERNVERYASHNFGPNCRRGHLKTARTWRRYRAGYRCLTCQYERERARAVA